MLNAHRFIQDAITHRDQLAPTFEALNRKIATAVMALTQDKLRHANAKNFVPRVGMTLRDALSQELIREPHLNAEYRFDENDAMDFVHAVPSAIVCDLILLDAGWCHKVESAAKRIRRGGVTGKIARCFSRRTVPDFLVALESMKLNGK